MSSAYNERIVTVFHIWLRNFSLSLGCLPNKLAFIEADEKKLIWFQTLFLFMNAMEFITTNDSIFSTLVRHRPRNSILCALRDIPDVPEELEFFFSQSYTLMTGTSSPQIVTSVLADALKPVVSPYCTHIPPKCPTEPNILQESDPSLFPAFMDAASRLSLLLALFPNLPTLTTTPSSCTTLPSNFPPLTDLARYFFSFPTRSTGPFSALVRLNDPRALLLLFYFYRAVRVLLPAEQCWWSCARTEYLEKELERSLSDTWKSVIEEGNQILNRNTSTANAEKDDTASTNDTASQPPQQAKYVCPMQRMGIGVAKGGREGGTAAVEGGRRRAEALGCKWTLGDGVCRHEPWEHIYFVRKKV
jgi:hypothetical protein